MAVQQHISRRRAKIGITKKARLQGLFTRAVEAMLSEPPYIECQHCNRNAVSVVFDESGKESYVCNLHYEVKHA